MRWKLFNCIYITLIVAGGDSVKAQELNAKIDSIVMFSENSIKKVESRVKELNNDFDAANRKYVNRLMRHEQKLKSILERKDSILSENLFAGIEEKYTRHLTDKLENMAVSNNYLGHLDSLVNTLSFLNMNKIGNVITDSKYGIAISQLNTFQSNMNRYESFFNFLNHRQEILNEQFQRLGLSRKLTRYKKDYQYYKAQINEYKEILNDPGKIEKKLLEIATALPGFQDFFAKNSQLSSLFVLPGVVNGNTEEISDKIINGISGRSQVYEAFNEKAGKSFSKPEADIQNKVGEAQAQVQSLQNRMASLFEGSIGNGNLVENAQPNINNQRSKSIGKRIVWGFNLQSQRATNYFPSRSDIGITAGYKFTDQLTTGIGFSSAVGWGNGFNDIHFSHLGIGLRSYIEHKVKGNFYAIAGFELNYRNLIDKYEVLKKFSNWQQSCLIGITKKYKVGKLLKGNVQLLWDVLSYRQIPISQPILFRIGYSIK